MNTSQTMNVAKVLFLFVLLAIGVSFLACSPSMDPSDADVRYTSTLTAQPGDQTALVNRCAHYISLARYDEAVADCTRALHVQPNSIHALQNRAAAYQRWGRLQQSLADWEQALASMEQDEFWRRNSPERIEYARVQIQNICHQLASESESSVR